MIWAMPSLGQGQTKTPSEQKVETQSANPKAAVEPLNYATLNHTVSIRTLRAGSHDDSGSSEYYFTVDLYTLVNTAEERNLTLEKRKKMMLNLGQFGETSIDSLAFWNEDLKKGEIKSFSVDGNTIRELAAKTLRSFSIQESDLTAMIEISMYKKQKKMFFFGDNIKLAATSYYPIPPTKFDAPIRTNHTLTLVDTMGTMVKLAIQYK